MGLLKKIAITTAIAAFSIAICFVAIDNQLNPRKAKEDIFTGTVVSFISSPPESKITIRSAFVSFGDGEIYAAKLRPGQEVSVGDLVRLHVNYSSKGGTKSITVMEVLVTSN
jgi:hypothetical protein